MSGRCRDCASATFGGSGLTVECGQGHGYNIDATWGCDDWSKKGEAAMTTATLHEQWQAAVREVDLATAKQHDVSALIEDENGRPLAAEWHRLQAAACRERTPENAERARRAWLVSMATDHLCHGTVPAPGDHEAAAIEAMMDERRGARV